MKFRIILTAIFILCGSVFCHAEVVQKETDGFVYYLYVPSSYESARQYPLIVALHWSTGRGTDMIERWKEPAEKYGYIVACPNSKEINYWDTDEDRDVLRMISDIRKDYSIDSNVFVTGFSGGAMFTYHLGVNYPDVFKAMAPFAGSLKRLLGDSINLNYASQPIPVLIVHGTNDNVVDISESYFAKEELEKYGYKVKLREIGGLNHEYQYNISWPIIQWFEKIKNG